MSLRIYISGGFLLLLLLLLLLLVLLLLELTKLRGCASFYSCDFTFCCSYSNSNIALCGLLGIFDIRSIINNNNIDNDSIVNISIVESLRALIRFYNHPFFFFS